MQFACVRIVTPSEGDASQLHVGLKGTMNALFLKDLADKTRRGQRGRVKKGKAGGGICFGYDVVRAQQRALHRAARLEPSAVPEGPGHGQADQALQSVVGVGYSGRVGAQDHR